MPFDNTPMAQNPVAALLLKALDAVPDASKWCKFTRDDGNGRHCALGMLDVAYYGRVTHGATESEHTTALTELSKVMAEKLNSLGYGHGTDPWIRMNWGIYFYNSHVVANVNNHEAVDYNFVRESFIEAANRAEAKALAEAAA